MSKDNIKNNIPQAQIIQTSTIILTHAPYNPFSSQNSNQNISIDQDNNNVHLIRPYLNDIKNEETKNTNSEIENNINNQKGSGINIDDEIALAQKQSQERLENERMAVEYENAIKAEIEQTTPLISDQLEIQILLDDYKDNLEYANSVKIITEKYKYIRKVRRDGNCFYRAFIYRLFEYICMKNDNKLFNDILKKIEGIKDLTAKNGYDWMIVEDFYTVFYGEFCSCFNSVNNNGVSVRDYMDNLFKDKEKGNYLIYFMRFCIAAYLKDNRQLYEMYIEGDFDTWIRKEVEAIDNEADQIQIMACVNYFEIGVKIEYLNKYKNEVVKFPEDKKDEDIFIEVLFTPGHYDILYH
jgi:ubiquitin thioesterase protein OTUB1